MSELVRGSIVKTATITGVVWRVLPHGAQVFPIVLRGAGRHRSDVRLDEFLVPVRGAVRPGAMRLVTNSMTVVGQAPGTLFARLQQAFVAEAAATRFEMRHYLPGRPRNEQPVRM